MRAKLPSLHSNANANANPSIDWQAKLASDWIGLLAPAVVDWSALAGWLAANSSSLSVGHLSRRSRIFRFGRIN